MSDFFDRLQNTASEIWSNGNLEDNDMIILVFNNVDQVYNFDPRDYGVVSIEGMIEVLRRGAQNNQIMSLAEIKIKEKSKTEKTISISYITPISSYGTNADIYMKDHKELLRMFENWKKIEGHPFEKVFQNIQSTIH